MIKPRIVVTGGTGKNLPAEDDLLLQSGLDGFDRQDRRSYQPNKNAHHRVAGNLRPSILKDSVACETGEIRQVTAANLRRVLLQALRTWSLG
jgi:hypothetical protein